MKAITYHRYGSPDVLRVEEVDKPIPAPNEVLIRVHAAEATKSDCEMRQFKFAVNWFWLPLRVAVGIWRPRRPILGGYFAGEIASVGADVEDYSVGDQVFGCAGLNFGAYGEFVALPASNTIVAKPRNMSFVEASAVPLGGLNALHFMRRANVQRGEHVLINGAGASIGAHAVQIAKSMGARVTAVDSKMKEDMLRRIGADAFIDYASVDFADAGEKFDVILNMVAKRSFSSCVNALRCGGRYLMANPRLSDMARTLFTNRFTNKTASFAFARESKEELQSLREMIERGQIVSIVDKVYPMQQAAAAHRRVESEQRCGAVVIAG